MSELFGNTKGLAASELRALKRLAQRRVGAEEFVSLDLARELFHLASQLRRRIGILISREGAVEELCVGTKDILYLPDLGRYRLGKGRLRRLRLIFSDLSTSPDCNIPQDIYTDLEKLRLDLVMGIKVTGSGARTQKTTARWAALSPSRDMTLPAVHSEDVKDLGRFQTNFRQFIEALEEQIELESSQEVKTGKTKALLVGVYEKRRADFESSMAELEELARTAGVLVLDKIIQRKDPDPRTLLGKGKIEEVVLRCLRVGADMIIFDNELRPSQWRALTNSTDLKVIDRSMLILDIFAQRAISSEGRLQVELAQLKYTLPRLVEKDAGLSRLTGGIGGRGPGETKLEIGRRRTRDCISELEKRIEKIRGERKLRRTRRKEGEVPLVSILGYTNVGKSTLFNALTGSTVLTENKLFATLDPAQRRVVLSRNAPVNDGDGAASPRTVAVLSDTVGFIRELPNELKNAFRATLEELREAKVLVHVLDASDREVYAHKQAVEGILSEMEISGTPTIIVLNKVDKAQPETVDALQREFNAVPVSALRRTSLADLQQRIVSTLEEVLGSLPQPEWKYELSMRGRNDKLVVIARLLRSCCQTKEGLAAGTNQCFW